MPVLTTGTAFVLLTIVLVVCLVVFISQGKRSIGALRPALDKSPPRNLDGLPLPAWTIQAKRLLRAWENAAVEAFACQMPPGNRLCPQVRLLDMLTVNDNDRSRQQTTRNRIGSKSVDFAVIDRAGSVVVVIELNDSSHDRPDRQDRDKLVRTALAQAGIPLAVLRPRQTLDLGPWLHQ